MSKRSLMSMLAVVCLAMPAAAMAEEPVAPVRSHRIGTGKLGLGIALGAPSSITGKYFLSNQLAFDVALDGGYWRSGGFGLHGDLLFHIKTLASDAAFDLPLYLGGGAQVASFNRWYNPKWYGTPYYYSNDFNVGARGIAGLALWLRQAPVEIYLEAGLQLWFGGFYLGPTGSLGARYYF